MNRTAAATALEVAAATESSALTTSVLSTVVSSYPSIGNDVLVV